jgi:hypothetical protein
VGIDFEEREPEAYFDIYRGLRQANVHFVVIGGQACNIWALLYEDSELAKERHTRLLTLTCIPNAKLMFSLPASGPWVEHNAVARLSRNPASPWDLGSFVNVFVENRRFLYKFIRK